MKSLRSYLAILALVFVTMFGEAANTIRAVSVSVGTGATCLVQIEVDNTDAFVAFQADIPIPAGFSYVVESAQLNPSRSSGHSLSASLLGNSLRLIAYSVGNTSFSGSSGTLISFNLKAGTIPGSYSMILNNTLLGNSQSQSLAHSIQNGAVTVLGPNIQGSATSLNFGRVALTTTGTQYINVQNTGNQNLVVSGITFTDAQFMSPEAGGFTLTAGQTRQISVKFAPTVRGTYSKQMKIFSNDPDTPEAAITLNSVGFAVNEIHTGSILAASGSSAKLEFSVNNMELLTGFQFDVNLPSPMKYITGSAVLFRNQDHSVLADTINSNTLRVVAFSASGKNFTGTNGKILSLDFDLKGVAGYYPVQISNVIIASTDGENILSASYNGSLQITSPDIHTNSHLNFGDVSVLSEGNKTLRIYNYGQEQLTVSQLMFSNDYFKSSQSLPFSVAPSGYFDLPVRFVKTTKGASNSTLKIISNDTDENPFTVQLSANAFVPNHIIAGSYSVMQGNKVDVQVEISNKEPFVAFQFDMDFPDGLTPDLSGIALTSRKVDHVFAATLISARKLRVIAWSGGQKSFTGETGPVVKIPFKASLAMPVGNYPLSLSNGLLSNSGSENVLYSMQNGSLTVQERVTVQQSIALSIGWNIFSSPILPDSSDLKSILQSLIDKNSLVKVQDEAGNSLEDWGIFGGWQNKIGNISPTEGYKIKVNRNDTIVLSGTSVIYPFSIALKAGWNIAGYPLQGNFNGMNLVQQLLDNGTLIKVQDEAGKSIEDWGIFGGWSNGIGDFKAGEGYKIKVNAKDTLWIYESYPKSSTIQPELIATTHFTPAFEGNGFDHMNINIVGLPINVMKVGDELAIFDGVTCVGAVTILLHHIKNQAVSIAASATDNLQLSGFEEGNQFTLKLWNSKNNQEFVLEPEIVKGTSIFTKHETTVASLEKYATTSLDGLLGLTTTEINCYPNPFSDEVTIEINLAADAQVKVEVLNQLGQRVKMITTKQLLPGGLHKLEWDGRNSSNGEVATGIYHVRIEINDSTVHRKIVLSK